MSRAALLKELRHLDIKLSAYDGQLNVDAPQGTITPQLKTQLSEYKDDLIAGIQRTYDCAIRDYLEAIGESDQEIIDSILEQCQRDPESMRYFVAQGRQATKGETEKAHNGKELFSGDEVAVIPATYSQQALSDGFIDFIRKKKRDE